MAQVNVGDRVKIHFTGALEDGTVFGSTREEGPFEFTIGEGGVLPGFENAIVGMSVGDTKTISLPPEDAYGQYREYLVFSFEKSEFPPDVELEVGKRLQIRLEGDETAFVIIKYITEDGVVLDANDPLAGHKLSFQIELLEIL